MCELTKLAEGRGLGDPVRSVGIAMHSDPRDVLPAVLGSCSSRRLDAKHDMRSIINHAHAAP